MKKVIKTFIVTGVIFFISTISLQASIREDEEKVKTLVSEGLYDPALVQKAQIERKSNFINKYVKTYGYTNAFLSILALFIFLFYKKLYRRSNRVKTIHYVPPYFLR